MVALEPETQPVDTLSDVGSTTPPEQQPPSNQLRHEQELEGRPLPKHPEQMTGRILDTIV